MPLLPFCGRARLWVSWKPGCRQIAWGSTHQKLNFIWCGTRQQLAKLDQSAIAAYCPNFIASLLLTLEHWRRIVKNIEGSNQYIGEGERCQNHRRFSITGGMCRAAPKSLRLCLAVTLDQELTFAPLIHSLCRYSYYQLCQHRTVVHSLRVKHPRVSTFRKFWNCRKLMESNRLLLCPRYKDNECLHNAYAFYLKISIFTRLTPGELEEFCRSHADLSL